MSGKKMLAASLTALLFAASVSFGYGYAVGAKVTDGECR